MHAQGSIHGTDTDFPRIESGAALAESPIRKCSFSVEVGDLVAALEHCTAWNKYGARREAYAHREMSDIWVRYNNWENFNPEAGLAAFNQPHESVWYPVADEIPQLKRVVYDVLAHLGDVKLGGVLITRIPPGCGVAPHVDGGWHAGYYTDKHGVQLKGTLDQSFNFEGYSLSALPGEVYWFDNSKLHWVENPSSEDRITMIICTREKR